MKLFTKCFCVVDGNLVQNFEDATFKQKHYKRFPKKEQDIGVQIKMLFTIYSLNNFSCLSRPPQGVQPLPEHSFKV